MFFNKLKFFFKRPGEYFRYKNKLLKKIYFHISKYTHFKTYYSRVQKKNFLSLSLKENDLINKSEGYKLISSKKLNDKNLKVNELLESVNNDLNKLDLQKFKDYNSGLIPIKSPEDFNIESPEFKFVTNSYLIEIVTRYLNCVPLLTNLSLWYSPNDKIFENSSQEYHLDHEDYKQVKGFLFINEIDLETGPLSIINFEQSNNIEKFLNYKMTREDKRVNDKVIKEMKKKMSINENIITGKPGDLLLCDTSNCFHFGSRLGKKPRFILAFQYITPFGFSIDWNWKRCDKLVDIV